MLAGVMAKKFAVGAILVVIDIPVGTHAKVTSVQEGRKLARDFIELGDRLGIQVEAALTKGILRWEGQSVRISKSGRRYRYSKERRFPDRSSRRV